MRGIAYILAPALAFAGLTASGAAAPAPVKLAVFPFELEDFSAGAGYVPADEIDREQLRLSTEEARRLMAQHLKMAHEAQGMEHPSIKAAHPLHEQAVPPAVPLVKP